MFISLNEQEMQEEGIHFHCREQRIYTMPQKGTFFGIHLQNKTHPQNKMISIMNGRGIDYMIDLRKESKNYMKWIAIELQAGDNQHIYIPQGYGHAFLSLEENTVQLFSIDEPFHHGETKQIRYDDPQIQLNLPIQVQAISEYDKNAPYLSEIELNV